MDHLLMVASLDTISKSMLQSLRLAGWKISMAEGIVPAKRLLQKGDIATVMVDLEKNASPERLKVLRLVQESCPTAMVILLQPGMNTVTEVANPKLINPVDRKADAHRESGECRMINQYRLTPAQMRIAEFVAQAYPNRDIARMLKIKEQSVRNQLSQIFKKLGILNRLELALLLRKGERFTSRLPKAPTTETLDSTSEDTAKAQELMTI